MRKVLYTMTVSLDGYVEDANGSIGWTTPSAELHQHFNDRESEIDLHLYGRRLYDTMKVWGDMTAWGDLNPISPVEKEYAAIWQPKPKVVFSTTLQEVGWNSRLVRGNMEEEVKRLKSQPGKYISVGGPGLAASLMQYGLIDEYWLYVAPVLLGGGKRFFPNLKEPIKLRLLETQNFPEGVVMLRYEHETP
jgi:dihydrofolate reductase